TVLFIGTYILTQFAEDTHDITYYTFFPIMALFIPLIWLARKNRKVSTLRSVVQLHGAFYCVYTWLKVICDIIIDRGDRMPSHSFLTAFYIAALTILIIATFRCRKQYVGKYT